MIQRVHLPIRFHGWLAITFFLVVTIGVAQPAIPLKLLPPMPELRPTFWEQHQQQIICGTGIGLVIILFLILLTLFWPRKKKIEPWEVAVRRELKQLGKQPENGAVLVRVSQLFKNCLLREYQLPLAELTTLEFQTILQTSAIDSVITAASIDFLRRCDRTKFAPPPGAPANAAENALQLLEKVLAQRLIKPPVDAQKIPG